MFTSPGDRAGRQRPISSPFFNMQPPSMGQFPYSVKTSGLVDSSEDSRLDPIAYLNPTKSAADWAADEGIGRYRPLEGTTFRWVMAMIPPPTLSAYCFAGMGLLDSTNQKQVIFGTSWFAATTLRFALNKQTAVSTGATWTHSSDSSFIAPVADLVWLRAIGDGTTLNLSASLDRRSWLTILNETFATFLTAPSHIGPAMFFRLGTGSMPAGIRRNVSLPILHFGPE